MFTQRITPTPDIPCKPGWCLQYVRETFGLPAVHPSATAAWHASPTQHRDRNYPAGVWFAVWWELDKNVHGHVALVAPDGSVYSTSSLKNTPYHHPSIAHVEAYYARYGMTLTYRGWTEDVQGTPVITPIEEDTLATSVDLIVEESNKQHVETRKQFRDAIRVAIGEIAEDGQEQEDVTRAYLKDRISESSPKDLAVQINAAGVAAEVRDELIKLLSGGQ